MWKYSQSTGDLSHNGVEIATGYSGYGPGKNEPGAQALHNIGPIPRGLWVLCGEPFDTPEHGPQVMRLEPASAELIAGHPEFSDATRQQIQQFLDENGPTETFGRDGFLIHGDSIAQPGWASRGCCIFSRNVRGTIYATGDRLWLVVE
jgi:hypothetical protein